jgi:type II secretory pathway component GspD/PulD (secretin)
MVVLVEHVPAVDAVIAITEWLESEREVTGRHAATVVAVPASNRLVISGSSSQLETIRRVVQELDQPSPRIRVKALLVDLALPEPAPAIGGVASILTGPMSEILPELEKRGEVRVLAQPEILADDGQPAFVKIGSRVPKVTGVTLSPRGRTNQLQLENVGTVLGVTGRVTGDERIRLEIDLEQSHLGPEDEGTSVATLKDEEVVRTPQAKTLTLQTSVSLHNGQAVLVGGMLYQNNKRCGELLLLVQPEIMD